MNATIQNGRCESDPKRPKPYDHNLNEPAQLIDEEPADIERDVPATPNEPVERPTKPDNAKLPAFEE